MFSWLWTCCFTCGLSCVEIGCMTLPSCYSVVFKICVLLLPVCMYMRVSTIANARLIYYLVSSIGTAKRGIQRIKIP